MRGTLRFRLTAVFSGLFLVAGAALLAITYLLVDGSTPITLFLGKNGRVIAARGPGGSATRPTLRIGSPTSQDLATVRALTGQAAAQHARDLHQLLIQSGFALGAMTVIAVLCGWLVAGRVLRPMRQVTAATQRITERNLHERLALGRPRDEVTRLAGTIDGLLTRLERAFEAQRRFVAHASHELRTPLTFDRALLEITLADPGVTKADLRAACQELLGSREHQERLVEALLTLASSERGLDTRETFALDQVIARVMPGFEAEADLSPALIRGNPALVERMAANLIDNAVRYNVPGGRVWVSTAVAGPRAVLTVSNTGPVVPETELNRLLEPFQRLDTTTARSGAGLGAGGGYSTHPLGHGLGLSIVAAIADAHDATLTVRARPAGGLSVEVCFPPPGALSERAQPERPVS